MYYVMRTFVLFPETIEYILRTSLTILYIHTTYIVILYTSIKIMCLKGSVYIFKKIFCSFIHENCTKILDGIYTYLYGFVPNY